MNLMLDTTVSPDAEHTPSACSSRPMPRVPSRLEINSLELLRGHRELMIVHGDQEYRLRITQNDKLILTK